MNIKHPEIAVKLIGTDGNAFAIIAAVRTALMDAGISDDEIQQFIKEVTAGDYDHLLRTCMEWVNVE